MKRELKALTRISGIALLLVGLKVQSCSLCTFFLLFVSSLKYEVL